MTALPLRCALWYAERGWPVFPLMPHGKAPLGRLVPNGVEHATRVAAQIETWWGQVPDANIGLACKSLLVVDVDPRNGGDVEAVRTRMPRTPTARTRDGGAHFLFKKPDETLGAKPFPGIDLIHGPRRYIVVAPSRVSPGCYEWTTKPNAALADCPEWILAAARPKPIVHAPCGPITASDEQRLKRARAYLAKVPIAIQGQGGDAHTFLVCSRIARGFALSPSDAFMVLSEWNRMCDPPWSESGLRRKINEALNKSRIPLGAALERR